MPADTSRRGLPARHLANSRSSCSRREVECLSPSGSAVPSVQFLSLKLLTPVSLPQQRDTCSMLRASPERVDGEAPLSQPQGAFGAEVGSRRGDAVQTFLPAD